MDNTAVKSGIGLIMVLMFALQIWLVAMFGPFLNETPSSEVNVALRDSARIILFLFFFNVLISFFHSQGLELYAFVSRITALILNCIVLSLLNVVRDRSGNSEQFNEVLTNGYNLVGLNLFLNLLSVVPFFFPKE